MKTTANSSYPKVAFQWLNQALCFVTSSVLADSLAIQNRQLLVAAKRCSCEKTRFPDFLTAKFTFANLIHYLLTKLFFRLNILVS